MADIKKIALTILVGVLLALFVGFLVDAVYSSPKYDEFCNNNNMYPAAIGEKYIGYNNITCPAFRPSIELEKSCMESKGYISYRSDSNGCAYEAYCETCSVEFENANKAFSRNLFFILIPISLILIIIGIYLTLDAIGSGFILGGILTIIYATIRIFGDLSKIMRVILLGVELALVIWLGYKRIEKGKKK